MKDLTLNILGFPAANRDLTVEIRDPVSLNLIRVAKPFLDGTVRVPKINPGAYEIALKHPNISLPVLRRPIHVLPVGETKISVVIDPSKFRNTPIEEIPDANLAPVQDLVRSIAETVTPLAGKTAGEAIRADDWNSMASAIRDLAGAVGELSRLVAPLGHNHFELEKKFDEITGNFEELINSVSASLTELQRQIQTQRFRKQIEDVLDVASVDRTSPKGKVFSDLVKNLEGSVTASPTVFGREARNTAVQLSTQLEALLEEKKDDPTVAASESVKGLSTSLDLLKGQRTTTYNSELQHHRKVDRLVGGGALKF